VQLWLLNVTSLRRDYAACDDRMYRQDILLGVFVGDNALVSLGLWMLWITGGTRAIQVLHSQSFIELQCGCVFIRV
jgi:hypothetical protein